MGVFRFVVLASRRATQLINGCTPRVAPGHVPIVTAQLEVAAGCIRQVPPRQPTDEVPDPERGDS
jgi:DNA-directed RNA polymerase subunit K/omega